MWELFEAGPPKSMNWTSAQIGLFFAISGVAAVTHFLAFTVFGLPLFLRFYREPYSRLWQRPFGIAVGLIIGTLAVPFVPALAWGHPIGQGLIEGATMGALYGTVTAIACLLNRPNVEQGVAPQPAARSESDFSTSLPPST